MLDKKPLLPPVCPGQVYGRLTAREIVVENVHDPLKWLCDCSCGNTKIVTPSALRSGNTQSCGCLRLGFEPRKTPEKAKAYAAHAGMKKKCNNPKDSSYPKHGGIGIKYDPAWESFEAFYKDMGEPKQGQRFGRIDASRNFTKDNCAWFDSKEKVNVSSKRTSTRSKKLLSSALTACFPLRLNDDHCLVGNDGQHIYSINGPIELRAIQQIMETLNGKV